MSSALTVVRLTVYRPALATFRKLGKTSQGTHLHNFVLQMVDEFVDYSPVLLESFVAQSNLVFAANFVDSHSSAYPAPVSAEFRLELPQPVWYAHEGITARYTTFGKSAADEAWEMVRPHKGPYLPCPSYMLTVATDGRTHGLLVSTPDDIREITC